MVGIYKR